jgi:hypothetical protein
MAVTIVRTASSSQINSLLTQASASATYLTQVSASTIYAPITPLTQTGFRNKIINGGFDIWQRGTSAFTTAGYTADRWVIQNASGQTISVTQQAFTPGNAISGQEPTNFLRISLSGTPSGTYWLTQKVEDVRTFAGQIVTLSFWAKAGSATTALLPALEQNFGSGGSSVVTTTGSAISLTTSWQRFTQTFSVPSISGKTIGTNSFLEVRPFLGSTAITGNNIDIWGVQLEAGSTATPFEQRFIGTELSLCQRYYQTSFAGSGVAPGHNASGNGIIYHPSSSGGISSNLYTNIRFPIMRTSPTVNIWNGNDASATPSTAFSAGLQVGATGIRIYTAGGVGYNSANIGVDYIRADSISIYAQASTGGATSGLLAFGYSLNAEL